MSIIFYYIIVSLEIFTGIWCIYRVKRFINYQRKPIKNKKEHYDNKANILIVIPCLHEQNIIIETFSKNN